MSRFLDIILYTLSVHIGKTSKIGNFVWIYPFVVLTNDPTPPSTQLISVVLEDFVVIATKSIILPGVKIREGTLVGALSKVRNDTNPNTLVSGNPATEKGLASGHEVISSLLLNKHYCPFNTRRVFSKKCRFINSCRVH